MNATETETSESRREVNAEWNELAAKYPTPTLDDVRADYLWIHEHASDGSIDPEGKNAGLHVAVYNQQVVGADADPTRLQIRLSRERNLHPARFITYFLFPNPDV
jgi:hypothetical protein